jgi:hypothetical protein
MIDDDNRIVKREEISYDGLPFYWFILRRYVSSTLHVGHEHVLELLLMDPSKKNTTRCNFSGLFTFFSF